MSSGKTGSENCREMFARLSEYLDEEIDPGAGAAIRRHLEDCPPCMAFLESLRRTVGLVEGIEPPPLSDELKQRLRRAIRDSQPDP